MLMGIQKVLQQVQGEGAKHQAGKETRAWDKTAGNMGKRDKRIDTLLRSE